MQGGAHLRQVDAYATPYAAFASRASVVVNHTDKVWPWLGLGLGLGLELGLGLANPNPNPNTDKVWPPAFELC